MENTITNKSMELLLEGIVGENSREPLIIHNLQLVVCIAKKFKSSSASVVDLISIGTIGLIKATNTFHPEKNIKFVTYASRCIENEILKYIKEDIGKEE